MGEAVVSSQGGSPGAGAGRKSKKPKRVRIPAAGLLTPAMRQYVEQKASAPDAILLFRMGDFYETFYEDAITASKVLGIALTSRSKDAHNPIPLAGIPHHALENYLSKLVRAGYKVAISEQVEDPKQAKGVVKREIVRVVTPGTLTDEALLDERAENLLVGVCRSGGQAGLAVAELSTGKFVTHTVAADSLVDELVRLSPSEILLAEEPIEARSSWPDTVKEITGSQVTRRPPHVFEPFTAEQTLLKHFGVGTLAGFGYEELDASLQAAGAVLEYLAETQRGALGHILSLRRESPDGWVQIDQSSWRSLEVDRTLRHGQREGSLLGAIDASVNPMGSRLLRGWLRYPLRSAGEIERRLEGVAVLHADAELRGEVRRGLKEVGDLQRIASRIGVGRAYPRDLVALGAGLARAATLRAVLENTDAKILLEVREALEGLDDLAEYLAACLNPDPPATLREGNIIAAGVDAELDRLRSIRTDGQAWLAEFQARLVNETGIASLKVGFNNVFGYYIEVTNTYRDKVPAHFVRKQTIKNAERYITDELKRHETEVLTAEERANELEYALFGKVCQRASGRLKEILRLAEAVAVLDVLAGLAETARRHNYVRPEICDESVLEITDGRHPVLEQTLRRAGGPTQHQFVPNDCLLDDGDNRLLVITGPNMAGKSTYIRQVALSVLMAQMGGFVPAKSMRWGVVDRIFARVGASDEISRGQSTFMVEMTEAANILHNATRDSLVILDEIGRGTSTFDGLSLAWAITEHLCTRVGPRTLFATHYHELTELADVLKGVSNYNVAVREWHDEIVFLYRIVPGATDKSYGVYVARLAGIPKAVVERSKAILAELESNFARESQTPQLAGRVGDGPGESGASDQAQLMLFGPAEPQLARELAEMRIEEMTPLEALNELKKLRDKYARGGD
jgi:DNA mismatch repair protein MutS